MDKLKSATALEYSVKLIDRNEGVEYRDSRGAYRFGVRRDGQEWTLLLPPIPEMRNVDESQMLDRITAYLSKIWWFGLFPRRYTVRVERK
jgi:hypothetical protein